MNNFFNITPIDGRYSKKCVDLRDYFSEYSFTRYRLKVEVEYLLFLTSVLPKIQNLDNYKKGLRDIYLLFSQKDMEQVKNHEKRVHHDVKSIELFLRDKLDDLGLSHLSEYVHFGLTSQDITSMAYGLSYKDYIINYYLPLLISLKEKISTISDNWKNIPMLSHTHGQPASPTTLGKELYVFVYRLEKVIAILKAFKFSAKFGGSVGNLNAHICTYSKINWEDKLTDFVNKFGLEREIYTTQIGGYDNIIRLLHNSQRVYGILLDMVQDIWYYISMEYIKQRRISDNQVGSSTMPHKINPINFENAEGNLQLADGLSATISRIISTSRLQRDLSDSTVMRNIGIIFSYFTIAVKSIDAGLDKIEPNNEVIKKDLEKNACVILEGIQTILRKHKFKDSYEIVRKFTISNPSPKLEDIYQFVKSLDISEEVLNELLNLTPFTYTGIFHYS